MISIAHVVIDARSAGQDAIFTYRCDPTTSVGEAYLVPLGPRTEVGFILRREEVTAADLGFPLRNLRSLGEGIRDIELPRQVVELVEHVSDEYLCPVPVAMSLAMPPGVRHWLATVWTLERTAESVRRDLPLSAAQKEVLRVLEERGGSLVEPAKSPLARESRKALRHLVARGYVSVNVGLQRPTERHRLEGLFRMTADQDRIERFLTREGKRRPAQAMTLIALRGSDIAAFSAHEIKALTGVTDQTLRALLGQRLLERVESGTPELKRPPQLGEHQVGAVEAMLPALLGSRRDRFLLHGVTGSGKTEVYLRLATEALRLGRQVLFLVPEIALTAHSIAGLRSRFGTRVALLHSALSPSERLASWLRIRSGRAPVVLGTRSALFAPLSNLGLIVVDEEHDSSYKQETAPRYDTRRMAALLGERHHAPVVFGSATPSLESYYLAQTGSYRYLTMPTRVAQASLPEVTVMDLREGYKSASPTLFSPPLAGAMGEALDRGEQVILFLNRRSYAPFLLCRECGCTFPCPNCAVSLAVHRREGILRCHHCDAARPIPDTCPNCQGHKVHAVGVGAERVEEAVRAEFPQVRVVRLDRDVARRKGAVESALSLFRSGDAKVLVGTQMVAKGLDFPNVTVVGVVAADVSLNVPDFRASERTFQLLSQVAGRAGRSTRKGHVFIQTFNPDHIAVTCARDHDYRRFAEAALEERRLALYPPFCRLANVVIAGDDLERVREVSVEARAKLDSDASHLAVVGPADCPIPRLQGLWRRHILVKRRADDGMGTSLRELSEWRPKGVTLSVDVDPQTLG